MTPLPTNRRLPAHALIALGLAFFSFFMSWLVSDRVFEHLPHLEDEVAYLYQARTYAGGQLVVETPQPRRAFWQPFVVDRDEVRFGKYSPGWPLLLAPGTAMGQPWVINAFFAALGVAVVYRLGREVFNPDAGVIAAALTAFSPMALLLNGTLMGHTAALFGVVLFLYAYWRVERGRRTLWWGVVGGLALGSVLANRPLTAVGVALPFVAWSLLRLLRALLRERSQFWPTLRPLLAVAVFTILFGLTIPLYNQAAAGSPSANLYSFVWEYDRIGFGSCCGRSSTRGEGHDLERAVRHMRFDLSLAAADLFGWQLGTITPEIEAHLQTEGDYFPNLGLSWLLLPFGLLVGFRYRIVWVVIWFALGYLWLYWPFQYLDGSLTRSASFSWLWMGGITLWLLAPTVALMLTRQPRRVVWVYFLAAVALGLIIAQMTYWIGSQRYSTRYYFEILPALALISALPLAWLARRGLRAPVYIVLAALLAYSLYAYSTPRINTLYRFNQISPELIEGIEARRNGDQPVLALIDGSNVRWRAYGSLMAVTSPYLNSDIVAAWAYDPEIRDDILRLFPDRQVIRLQAHENDAWFVDEATGS